MMAVGNNLARAFGLFGALALVRFRTPVKDTRDTAFLFIAVGVGIAVGSQNIVLAVVGTLALTMLAIYLSWTDFGARFGHDGLLRFRLAGDEGSEAALRAVLLRYCRHFALVHLRDAGAGYGLEHAYQVQLLAPDFGPQLTAEMQAIAGVGDVSLLMQDRDTEP